MRSPKICFLFFSPAVILWSFFLYFYLSQNPAGAFKWIEVISILALVCILSLLCFVTSFSKKRKKMGKSFLVIFLALAVLVILSFFIGNEISKSPPPPSYVAFFLLLFVYIAWVATILFERSLETSEEEHARTMAVLFGFGLFATAVMFSGVFIPLMLESTKYFWLIPASSIFLAIFSAFVISPFFFSKKPKSIVLKFFTAIFGIILLVLPFTATGNNLKIFIVLDFLLFCAFGSRLIKTKSADEKDAEKLATEWEKLNHSKDQFILSFQHHLRTPLVPIKGYLEMILKGAYGREENPIIRERLIDVKKRVEILSSLIEGLLDAQEARVGGKNLNTQDCQVNDLIESVIEELTIETEEKKLYMRFKKSDLPEIKADKDKLRVAIWNLVDNAIKYTGSGGITITSEVEKGKIKIGIADTGIGMDKEEIEQFLKGELFERGEEAKKLYGPGRGIGLGLAIEFIKAHKGKVWAESKGRSQGTTFWIEIPTNN